DRGVACSAKDEIDGGRVVDDRRGIRLADDGGDAARGRGLAGRREGFAVAGAGFADKGAHIDQPRGHDLARAIDDVGTFGDAGSANAALGVADDTVGDQDVTGTVEIARGV